MRREEAGSVQRPHKKQVAEICQHFPGLQLWMSDTEKFLFLDPALQKQAVKVKKMEKLRKKVECKVTEMVELRAWRQRSGAECRVRVQG